MGDFDAVVRLDTEGMALQESGRHVEAIARFDRAIELAVALEGRDSPDVANLSLHRAASHAVLGRFEASREDGRHAASVLEPIVDRFEDGLGYELLGQALGMLGRAEMQLGNFPEARAHLEQALALARAGSEAEAQAENDLGMLCKYSGAFAEGEAHYARALAFVLERHGEEAFEAASIYHNIGGILHAQDRFAEAEEPARRAWRIRERHLGPDHELTLADLAAWAGVLDGLERLSESEAIYRRVIAAFEARHGPESYEVAANLNNLGGVLVATDRMAEGIAAYERALAIKAALVGEASPDWALGALNLAAALAGAARRDEARALARRALAACEATLPADHPLHVAARALLDRLG